MKDFSSIIGKNLYNIRKQRNYSLDKVAELTGVSKGMLSQIEKGISNPTVTTLWKIATGLKVSFSYFMEEPTSNIQYVAINDISPILEEKGNMKVYPIFPFDNDRKFEVFSIILEPGCSHRSEAHNEGVEEYIIVTEGILQLEVADQKYDMNNGDAIRYYADKVHCYSNKSTGKSVFQHIIFYEK